MTDQDYKAEITGPFDAIFFKYRIEYFYRGRAERWSRLGNWDEPEGARTFEKAEKIAKRKLETLRAYDAAQANKVTVT